MAELYTVNYKINVDSASALTSLQKFQEATATLTRINTQIEGLTKRLGRLNSAFVAVSKSQINVTVNTKEAEGKLIRLRALMRELTTLSRKGVTLTPPSVSSTKLVPGSAVAMARDMEVLRKLITSAQSEINALNKTSVKPQAHVESTQKRLTQLLNTLKGIQANSNIIVKASGPKITQQNTTTTTVSDGKSTHTSQTSTTLFGTGSKKGSGSGSKSTTPPKTKPPKTATPPPAFPIQKAGKSTYLYPTTRQVIGPTYAGTGTTVGGEMIKGMGMAYGISALMSGVTSVFRDATEYENISQTTKNILGSNDHGVNFDGRFESLNQLMRQVGVETKFTAPEVASAGKFLAMAGMNMDAIRGAIRPITNMALIGDTDLGETADVVTNIMTAFEIMPDRVGNAADVLTMTATNTNTTLMTLAESFKYAGTLAHQTGLSIEETAAIFGVLGNAGRQGSQAGTDLRMMLMNIMNPTKKQKKAWEAIGISAWDKKGNLREFTDILSDLNEKSKSYSPDQFSKLVMQMFRITATSGALALIHSSDKVKEVLSKNQQAGGIADKLGKAKQNTIAGLWAQMTSAFTESGIQGFESLQGVIRTFLQEMISLMKSTEFTNALRDGMKLFLYMGDAFKTFLGSLSHFLGMFGDTGKEWLMWLVKVQLYLNMGVGTLKSIWSMTLAIRGVLLGSWLSASVGHFLRFAVVMRRFYRATMASSLMLSFKATALGKALIKLKASFSALSLVTAKMSAKNAAVAAATTAGTTAATTAGTAAVTGAAVGATATKTGWITKIFGGSASPLLVLFRILKMLVSGPAGWIAMIATAIGGVWAYISHCKDATQEAVEATNEWSKSYKRLGIDKLDLLSGDNYIIANMRIYDSALLSQQERVKQSIELYNQLWEAQNRPPKKVSDETPYIKTEDGKKGFAVLNKQADAFYGVYNSFKPLIDSLGGVQSDSNGKPIIKVAGRSYHLSSDPRKGWFSYLSEEDAVKLQLIKYATDPNNSYLQELEKKLAPAVTMSLNSKNAGALYNSFIKEYTHIKPNYHDYNWSSETLSKKVEEEWQHHPYSADILNTAARMKIDNAFAAWIKTLQAVENGTSPDIHVRNFLYSRFGQIFNPSLGAIGGEKWTKELIDWQQNPTAHKFLHQQAAANAIVHTHKELVKLYNSLPKSEYKSLLAPYINESIYQRALIDNVHVGTSTFGAPEKVGEKRNFNGKQYSAKKDSNGLLQWYDSAGKIFTPTTADQVSDLNPSSTHIPDISSDENYKSKYGSVNAAPKQVIVRIGNFMNVDSIDLSNPDKKAIVEIVKNEALPAFVDFMADVSDSMVNT